MTLGDAPRWLRRTRVARPMSVRILSRARCIDRREASRNPQRGGVMASVPPNQTIMPSQVFRGGPLLFVRLGSRRSGEIKSRQNCST
jgi:hypothetical protein